MTNNNILLSITFAMFCCICYAQKTVNQFDKDGKRDGLWTKNYHKTDQKRYEGVFKHGKEIDSFKYYTLNAGKSVLSAVKVFNENDSIAEVTFLASTKKVISKGKMNGKRFMGKWVYYHKNSSDKMIVENFNEEGLLQGERFVYYKNGLLAESANYRNGKLDGEAKWFSERDILLKHTFYKNDQLEGKAKYYDGNGELTSEGNYIKDQKKGIWKYYNDGKLSKEVDHTNQKVISKKQ